LTFFYFTFLFHSDDGISLFYLRFERNYALEPFAFILESFFYE